MKEKSEMAATLLAVIRGEMPLSALSGIGVQISCQEDSCQLDSKVTGVFVTPLASDLAQGFVTYHTNSLELKLWAFFLLGEAAIDFAEVEVHPQGETLIEALWNASFTGSITETVIKVAESLASAPTLRWK